MVIELKIERKKLKIAVNVVSGPSPDTLRASGEAPDATKKGLKYEEITFIRHFVIRHFQFNS